MTPYHIFLASTYAHRTAQDIVVLLDQNQTLTDYAEFPQSFFQNYRYVSVEQKKRSAILQTIQLKRNISQDIINLRDRNPISDLELFIFNDSTIQAQYLIQSLKPKKVYYMEDGSAPYNQHFIKHSKLKTIVAKMLLGPTTSLPTVLGTSRAIAASILTFPELARVDNNPKTRKKFETSPDKLDQTAALFDKHPRILEIKTADLNSKGALILLPPSQSAHKGITEGINNTIIDCIDRGITVYLKAHPLSQISNPSEQNESIKVVPSSIPAEAIPLFVKHISEIYSPPNTALLSYAYFHKSVHAFCITDSQSIENDILTQNIIRTGATAVLAQEQ